MNILYKLTYQQHKKEKYAYFKKLAEAQIYQTVLKGKITIVRGK